MFGNFVTQKENVSARVISVNKWAKVIIFMASFFFFFFLIIFLWLAKYIINVNIIPLINSLNTSSDKF